jgi:inhibitor of KinA
MRIFPLGDNAITVEFGNEISLDLNRMAISLSEHFESDPFPGFIETVPAYSSATIFFDPIQVRQALSQDNCTFHFIRKLAEQAAAKLTGVSEKESELVEIPVFFDSESSLDLGDVGEFSGLNPDEIISIFLAGRYRVYMIGFLPGFAYMGEVDDRIAIARKPTPRTKVPAGSVGIAGKQTGIYPLESPGGWQIIGRTDMKMFDPGSDPSCPLRPGDLVKFIRA